MNTCRASPGKVQVAGVSNISFLSISPANRDIAKDAGTTTFSVSNTGTGEKPWTFVIQPGGGWLQIQTGASGNNGGKPLCDDTRKGCKLILIKKGKEQEGFFGPPLFLAYTVFIITDRLLS
jgi:hypothetical protein